MSEPTTYILTIRAERDDLGRPAHQRVRLGLKLLLRACGLRCVECHEVHAEASPDALDAATRAPDAKAGQAGGLPTPAAGPSGPGGS